MNSLTEEQIGLVTRISKIPEISKLFMSEETEWKAVVLMQNSLNGEECSKYINIINTKGCNMLRATIEQRVEAFVEVKYKR